MFLRNNPLCYSMKIKAEKVAEGDKLQMSWKILENWTSLHLVTLKPLTMYFFLILVMEQHKDVPTCKVGRKCDMACVCINSPQPILYKTTFHYNCICKSFRVCLYKCCTSIGWLFSCLFLFVQAQSDILESIPKQRFSNLVSFEFALN